MSLASFTLAGTFIIRLFKLLSFVYQSLKFCTALTLVKRPADKSDAYLRVDKSEVDKRDLIGSQVLHTDCVLLYLIRATHRILPTNEMIQLDF